MKSKIQLIVGILLISACSCTIFNQIENQEPLIDAANLVLQEHFANKQQQLSQPQQTVQQPIPAQQPVVVQFPTAPSQQVQPQALLEMNVGITTENRHNMIGILNKLLADNFVLYTKALNYHWNVKGELFTQFHYLFRKVYEALAKVNDKLAERIRALGGRASASLHEFSQSTQLAEDTNAPEDLQMIQLLLNDLDTTIRALRLGVDRSVEYKDAATNSFLADLLYKQEKIAWMLRAHLAQ